MEGGGWRSRHAILHLPSSILYLLSRGVGSMDRLDGRVALVTGGGRGIGRAVAAELARLIAAIVLSDMQGEVISIREERAQALLRTKNKE